MMLKRSTRQSGSQPSASARLVRAGLAGLAVVTAAAALATGCLDRPVVKAEPKTSNVFVDQIVQTSVDKIDLLFMVDNSVSMADKQEILKAAVPVLVGRLVSPICIDPMGAPTGASSPCKAPAVAEFSPIGDIHIGIVSSSLGAHGGTVCSTGAATDTLNDKGELIGTLRPLGSNPDATLTFDPAKTWNNSGFLAWDLTGRDMPPGEKNAMTLTTNFQDMIHAVGEHGCGYEASLEAWYRFLIDPEPPASVDKVGGATLRSSSATPPVIDMNILAQRKAFLRPDSLVAIVMMSDENDCSIRDDSVGWFVGSSAHMPRSTSQCAANPNDPCCRSCAQNEPNGPPAGCPALSADDVCKTGPAPYTTWDGVNDSLNLRCYNQHQRFGFDLLYETSRYVNALTNTTLTLQSNGTTVTNPLYDTGTTGKVARDKSLVFLAGIVGVPWQDIADAPSLTGAGLNYLTAKELGAQGRWAQLLGDPTASPPVPPSDPFMIETPGSGPYPPRTGMNPNAVPPEAIMPATSTSPTASKINGHEQNVPALDDLQYACTFKLTTPKVCGPGDPACDCSPDKMMNAAAVVAANSPLCQPPGGGAAGTTQNYAKAYPGARELQVLKDFGDNAIVASICPKVTQSANPSTDPNYGYNPAVGAIINRLKEALKGKCLPRALETNGVIDPATMKPGPLDLNGQPATVLCKVIEAQKTGCDCTLNGRAPIPAGDPIVPAVQRQLSATGNCGTAMGQTACNAFCMCEIKQETGKDLSDCKTSTTATPGYCYIDDPNNLKLKNCPDNQKRLLSFVDSDTAHKTPALGAIAFIACLGAPL